MRATALLPALALLAVAACDPAVTQPTGPTADDPLAGTWRVYSIGGVKTENPAATEMTFTGLTTLTASFGCNRLTANYTYERNVLFVTNITGTQTTCGGTPGRQERNGLHQLALPMTVVPGATTAILSGREGQSFALSRDGSQAGSTAALPPR